MNENNEKTELDLIDYATTKDLNITARVDSVNWNKLEILRYGKMLISWVMKILTPGSDMMQKCADYRLAKGLIMIVMKKTRH